MIALDLIELRFPWRGFWQDWGVASICIALYLALGALLSGAGLAVVQLGLILPQLALSILLFPVFVQLVTLLDRMRLTRIKRIG